MTKTPQAILMVRDLRKSYGDLQVLKGVSVDIEPGEESRNHWPERIW